MRHYNYEPNFYPQNFHNDYHSSQNKSGHVYENIVTQNLNKYNSPSSPYSP